MFALVDGDLAARHQAILLGRETRTAQAETYLLLHDNGDGSYTGRFRIPSCTATSWPPALDRLTGPAACPATGPPARPAASLAQPDWSPPSSTPPRCPSTSAAPAACTPAPNAAPWP